MNGSPWRAIGAAIAFLGVLLAPALAGPASFDADQTKAIQKIIRDTLVNDPAILRDALLAMQKHEIAAEAARREKSMAANADRLYRSPHDYVAGNPKGDVSVVEFFDYNCPYCRQSMDGILKLIESDAKVRLVLKELPILGEGSVIAARAAIASKKQGKYMELHRALMEAPGRLDSEDRILRIAKKAGLDTERLKADMKSPEVAAAISESHRIAEQVGVQATPTYIIGNEIVNARPSEAFEILSAKVLETRKKGCKTC